MARQVHFSARLTALIVLVLLHETCSDQPTPNCTPSCGDSVKIRSPFRLNSDPEACGQPGFNLSCENNHPVVETAAGKYYIRQINYDNQTIRVVDSGILYNANSFFIPRSFLNITNLYYYWSWSPYMIAERENYPQLSKGVVFLICEKPMNSPLYYNIPDCFDEEEHSPNSSFSHSMRYRYVRVGRMNISEMEEFCQVEGTFRTSRPGNVGPTNISCSDLRDVLQYGFELSYWVDQPWRICHILWYSDGCDWVVLYFFDGIGSYLLYGPPRDYLFAIGIHRALITIVGIPLVIALLIRKWCRRHLSMYDVIEEYLQTHNNFMPIRYSYSEIKMMTKGFKDKLGEGGFSTVYKGTLRSDDLVAIKMLNKSKGDGQDFINEVATVGRIHHVNVVQLIGFCVEGSKRTLIYEFMPNGSLNKHIFSPEGTIFQSYKRIYDIALGVARGIDYLHRGCEMQILHFDIKPHNILLDENFVPKIFDFGLAKLFPIENSIVSLTAIRGTLGYIAPELFYRNIGGISYKADVYSFGNLLMEMASRRKNVDVFVEHSSQIYFPTWIYDQLYLEKDIEIEKLDEEEKKLVKKMVIVALWCIQMKPSERPSKSKVVEMLEGEVQSLQMPPKPSLQSLENPIIEVKENSYQTSSSYQFEESISEPKEVPETSPLVVGATSTCLPLEGLISSPSPYEKTSSLS